MTLQQREATLAALRERITFPVCLDFGVQECLAETFYQLTARDVFLDMMGVVQATLHTKGESRVLKAWSGVREGGRPPVAERLTGILKICMYEAVDLIRSDSYGDRHRGRL
jgi:hypothetical protein